MHVLVQGGAFGPHSSHRPCMTFPLPHYVRSDSAVSHILKVMFSLFTVCPRQQPPSPAFSLWDGMGCFNLLCYAMYLKYCVFCSICTFPTPLSFCFWGVGFPCFPEISPVFQGPLFQPTLLQAYYIWGRKPYEDCKEI